MNYDLKGKFVIFQKLLFLGNKTPAKSNSNLTGVEGEILSFDIKKKKKKKNKSSFCNSNRTSFIFMGSSLV